MISGCLVSDVRSCVSFKDVKTALLILLALLWKSMMVIWIGLVKVELIRFYFGSIAWMMKGRMNASADLLAVAFLFVVVFELYWPL